MTSPNSSKSKMAELPSSETPKIPDRHLSTYSQSNPRTISNSGERNASNIGESFDSHFLHSGENEEIASLAPQISKNSNLLNEIFQRQRSLEKKIENVMGSAAIGKGDRMSRNSFIECDTQPGYSLAGPRPAHNRNGTQEEGADLRYDRGRISRLESTYGLDKPFPRPKHSRWASKRDGNGSSENESHQTHPERHGLESSDSGNPQGQIGGGPGGHHGSPVRGRPLGETPGGPAALETYTEDDASTINSHQFERSPSSTLEPSQTSSGGRGEQTTPDSTCHNEEESQFPNAWFAIRRRIREPLAEWLATMVAVLVGVSANLQVKTSDGTAGSFTQEASMWGLGTMMAIYIAGGVSGAHCNPMISIVLCLFRGFPARRCVVYILAQVLGAICAVWIAYGIYQDAIMSYDPQKTSTTNGTGTAFYTLPRSFATPATAFFTDFTSAAVMSGTILAMGDDTNSPPGAGMHAFIIGLVGFALASTLGYNTGPQTNPAKDFATRFVPSLVGYGSDMWQQAWWVEAWCAAIFGGIFGCLVYDIAIFEGPESPINYPKPKAKSAIREIKYQWHKTGLFGKSKRQQAKRDLEAGKSGVDSGKKESSEVSEK